MAGHKIDKLSLSKYFDLHRAGIIAADGWQHRTNEIVAATKKIAPNVPETAIRKAYLKAKKTWLQVDEDLFTKNFIVEE